MTLHELHLPVHVVSRIESFEPWSSPSDGLTLLEEQMLDLAQDDDEWELEILAQDAFYEAHPEECV